MDSDSIKLSSNEFKALASETRTSIIKLLQERNYTLSEFSKKMNLAAPTVKQHLETLEKAEIITQVDEGRKWKYYTLTRKGKEMFKPEQTKQILLVLGASVLALGALLYSFLGMFAVQASEFGARTINNAPQSLTDTAGSIVKTTAEAGASVQETVVATQPVLIPLETIIAFTAIIIIVSICLGFAISRATRK